MDINTASVTKLREHVKRMRSTIARSREESQATVRTVVDFMEVNSAAFAMGWSNGRFGAQEFVGIPLELWLGGALHWAAFLGMPGGDDLHQMGNGVTAAFSTTLGAGIGSEMAGRASGVPGVSGALPRARHNVDHELARLAQLA